MDVKQIYEIVNQISGEVLGTTDLLKEDLSNIVDLGTEIFSKRQLDNYVKALTDRIGRVVFVNRKYNGKFPTVLRDGWEYGSILQKINGGLYDAKENQSWELEDGQSYDDHIFYKPKASQKFYNIKTTFEIRVSFTEMQVKESFTSPTELNAFISMIYNDIEKSMTVKFESLVLRLINNFIGETVYDEYQGASVKTSSGVKAINLLYLYNQEKGTSLTADKCLTDKDFLRFASSEISLRMKQMSGITTLFNIGEQPRFTPRELMHVVLLSSFTSKVSSYLESDTFHKELVALPNYEDVPFWQGTGLKYSFDDVSSIDIMTASGQNIQLSGILGVIFDHDALGMNNYDRRVRTSITDSAEFTTNYYKFDCQYFNDTNENFIVFFVA